MFTFTGEGGRGEEAQKESSVTKGDCSYEEGRRIASPETKKKRTKQNKTKKNKPTSQEERGRRRKHRGERSYDLTQSVPCSPGDFLIHSGLVMMILKNNMW